MKQEKDKIHDDQKKTIFKGIAMMFGALPFVFAGPSLMFGVGIPHLNDGRYAMFIVSIILMILAGVIGVTGLKKVLAGFFERR